MTKSKINSRKKYNKKYHNNKTLKINQKKY